ncbi:MAG TPA: hypothetical protein VJ960_02950 [Oceanipulchritudo sp.]|nr:hypothetical protein [Oceanipulchritudo sp.]
MRGIRWLFLIGFGAVFLPLVVTALHLGQSPESVRAELGDPNGVRQLADGEIWVYSGDIALTFKEDRLVRARGKTLSAEPAEGPTTVPEESETVPVEREAGAQSLPEEPGEGASGAEESLREGADGGAEGELDAEIRQFSEELPDLADLTDEAGEDALAGKGPATRLLQWLIPVLVLFVFLFIAFKWVGAEADKGALFLIAMADRLVTAGVQWFFFEVLTYPTTFHADTLTSFIVVLVLVTKMTHARSLPTAIKVVVAAKVAALIAFYLLAMFLLFNL